MKTVSFIILNWNGESIIHKCLQAAVVALDYYKGHGEILVVDNNSNDKSIEIIKNNFPQVKLICLEKNYGFSIGNNIGVEKSSGDIVVLLNNDVYVKPDFLVHIVPHFNNENIFSVNPKVYGPDGIIVCRTCAYFHRGNIKSRTTKDIYLKPIFCLFAGGGVGAFDRKKFLELGGFLDLLYWEDFELGYRAWKLKGWQTIYEPKSAVYHDFGSSFNKVYTKNYLKKLSYRNRFLFQWSSITDPFLRFEHFWYLPFNLIYYLIRGDVNYYIGFIQALVRWRKFKREVKSKIPKLKAMIEDKEILKIVN